MPVARDDLADPHTAAVPRGVPSPLALPAASPDRATRLLIADHHQARALLERYRLLAGSGADERDAVGEELCELLVVHATLEEELLYPAAAAAGVDAALLDAHAHRRLRDAVARVRAMHADDAQRAPALIALAQAACRHADDEEATLFACCRAAAMDLDALGERLNERQAELLVNGAGRAAPAAGGLLQRVRKVFEARR
jgi:hypothetical protein